MWAKLLILRAHFTAVKQGWEMEWLNRAQGWQSINCRRTQSQGGTVGKPHTMRASCSLHQVRQVTGVEAGQNAAWEVAREQCSIPLWEPLQTHLHGLSKSYNAALEIRVPYTCDRASETGQETLDYPSHHPCIYSKVKSSGKLIYMIWEFHCCCFSFSKMIKK